MFNNIFSTFANCFKIPELKSRILFTLGLLAVARVLAYVPIPGINAPALEQAVFPRLSKLAREEGGRAKIVQYGRYLTVPICLVQGLYFANSYLHPGKLFQGFPGHLVIMDNIVLYYFLAVTVMTTGTLLLMWFGEQITERGIGNGVSLIITIGIVAGLPYAGSDLISMFWPSGGAESQYNLFTTGLMLVVLLVGVIAGI